MEDILQDPRVQQMLPYLIVGAIVQILLWLFLANSVRLTLRLIKEDNRCMFPSQAWFMAIPLFNIYWNFVVVRRLIDSLNNEFFDRKIAVEENPTQKQGYFYSGSFLASNFPLPAFLGYMAAILSFVALISYWVKISEYKKLLKRTDNFSGREDEGETWRAGNNNGRK